MSDGGEGTRSRERERLLRDETAADELLTWARRNGDVFAEAVALARHEPDGERWRQICALAAALDADELAALDAALESWPTWLRSAPSAWLDPPRPALRLARTCCFVHIDAERSVRLVRCPHLAQIVNLRIERDETEPEIAAGWPVDDVWLPPEDGEGLAAAIAASDAMAALAYLMLRGLWIGDEGASALAASTRQRSLRQLQLAENCIGDEGARALAESEGWPRLEKLGLFDNAIGADGARRLVQSPARAALRRLDLSWNPLGDEGAEAIAGCAAAQRLVALDLAGCKIGDAGARALAASKHLAGLEVLALTANEFGAEGARALARSPHLPASFRAAWQDTPGEMS